MRGSRKFCQRGFNFDNVFFLVDQGRKVPNTTISWPSSADNVPTLNAGLVAL